MVVNLQPQRDICKDTEHHHEKRGLPRWFTTYFDSFWPNLKNDTGLPLIYIVNAGCTWLWWHNIPVLSTLKLIIFVNIVLNWNNRPAQRIRCAERLLQLSQHLNSIINSKTKRKFKVQKEKSKCECKIEARCQNKNQLKRFSAWCIIINISCLCLLLRWYLTLTNEALISYFD